MALIKCPIKTILLTKCGFGKEAFWHAILVFFRLCSLWLSLTSSSFLYPEVQIKAPPSLRIQSPLIRYRYYVRNAKVSHVMRGGCIRRLVGPDHTYALSMKKHTFWCVFAYRPHEHDRKRWWKRRLMKVDPLKNASFWKRSVSCQTDWCGGALRVTQALGTSSTSPPVSSGTDSPLKTNSGQAHCACAVINEGSGNDIETASFLSNGSTYLNIMKCLLILGDHIHMDDFLIAKLANFTVK